jgi:hypothetical protein
MSRSRLPAFPPRPLLAGRKALAMRRVAVGQEVAVAAKACGMKEDDVRAMLGDAKVAGVLATYRDLLVVPDPLRLHMLRNLCFEVILEAVEERESRVCAWYFHELRHEREPDLVLARSIERMLERTPAEPPDRPPPAPPAAHDPESPDYPNRARLRVLARLRLRVLEELAARRAVLLAGLGHDAAGPAPLLAWLPGLDLTPVLKAESVGLAPEPRAGP